MCLAQVAQQVPGTNPFAGIQREGDFFVEDQYLQTLAIVI